VGKAGTAWAYRIGQPDVGDVHATHGLSRADAGGMVELGLAIAWESHCRRQDQGHGLHG